MTAEAFVRWLETGDGADQIFAADAFGDLTFPQRRMQAATRAELLAIRAAGHPYRGEVRVERLEPTARGWAMQVEERWTDETGAPWYCREMFRADVDDTGLIREIAVYCCGDWDEATAAAVTLLRP